MTNDGCMMDALIFRLARHCRRCLPWVVCGLMLGGWALAQAQPANRAGGRLADYIVAVVNSELITQVEVEQRLARVREEALRARTALPSDLEMRRQALDALIDERVQTTYARDGGMKVDDAELDRAVANIAVANKLTMEQLRERLKADGSDMQRFRANLRDQILADRAREREVSGRIKISEAEIDQFLQDQRARQSGDVQLNIAQILLPIPEGATPAQVAEQQALMRQVQARLKAGEAFDKLARELSQDGNRSRGGEIGLRPASRLPDVFVTTAGPLAVGQVAPEPLRSSAGLHLLKLLARTGGADTVVQTRARHILLRPSQRLTPEAAAKRLSEFREQVVSGKRSFEALAQQYSEDGSAMRGGDLGWASPGQFVPEFEQAMSALGQGGISQPLVSRFGVHLIQVVDRREVPVDPRQAREQARNALRERKFEEAYVEWLAELRSRAYIEMREPPL